MAFLIELPLAPKSLLIFGPPRRTSITWFPTRYPPALGVECTISICTSPPKFLGGDSQHAVHWARNREARETQFLYRFNTSSLFAIQIREAPLRREENK